MHTHSEQPRRTIRVLFTPHQQVHSAHAVTIRTCSSSITRQQLTAHTGRHVANGKHSICMQPAGQSPIGSKLRDLVNSVTNSRHGSFHALHFPQAYSSRSCIRKRLSTVNATARHDVSICISKEHKASAFACSISFRAEISRDGVGRGPALTGVTWTPLQYGIYTVAFAGAGYDINSQLGSLHHHGFTSGTRPSLGRIVSTNIRTLYFR